MKRIYNAFLRFLYRLPLVSEKIKLEIFERLKIHRKKKIYSTVTLTKEETTEIQAYWKDIYGKKISTKWHRLYQSYTGKYDKQYFPEILYSTKLASHLFDFHYARVLKDKNLMYSLFASDVYCPTCYGKIIRGVCVNGEGAVISREQLAAELSDIGECVLKQSTDTSSGKGVVLCNFQGGIDRKSGQSIEALLRKMGKDITVQERVKQHEALNTLYPHSLNTFRVITYIANNDIHCAPLALRLGTGGKVVDNIHSGGIGIGVRHDGTLLPTAFTEYGKTFTAHPDTGTVFEGYRIPFTEDIVETAKRLHRKLPHLGMISWDFSLNADGLPTLIELNLTGQAVWFTQMLHGCSMFGEHTAYMAGLMRKHKT